MKVNLSLLLFIFFLSTCNNPNNGNIIKINTTPNYLKCRAISDFSENTINDSINESWIKEDSIFLSNLNQCINSKPQEIMSLLGISNNEGSNLGFGYTLYEGSMGKGYISVFYNIITLNGKIEDFELTPQLPDNGLLTERYLRFYNRIFKIEGNFICNYYYNIKESQKAITGDSTNILNESLLFLMTPYAGTKYGVSGGFGNQIFQNRQIFIDNYNQITPEVCLLLIKSKNPATRLLGIEFYYVNQKRFNNIDTVEKWIEKVFGETPQIKTMNGCLVMKEDSRTLVKKYSQQHYTEN